MSISSRSAKAAMYSEIERLRSLLDQQDQQLRAQRAELAQLRAQRDEHRAMSASRTRNELMKRLAITCRASVKWVDGQGFKQYKDGNWVAVPAHTIEFASKNL